MRIAERGLGDFLIGENFFDGFSLTQITAQDCVKETNLVFETGALGEFHGFVNSGVRRDAVEPKNLVKPQAQEVLEHGALRSSRRSLALNQPVERSLPAHNAADEFVAQPAICGRKPGIGERNFEEIFRKFAAVQALR